MLDAIAASLPPEHRVLLREEPDPAPRLNLILPHCFANHAFGGVLSALEIGRTLSRRYPAFRLVAEHTPACGEPLFNPRDCCHESVRVTPEVHSLARGPLPCHQREIFCCTWWTTTLAWEAYAAAMAEAGHAAPPFYYCIQDFEPGFYQLGSNYMASLASYRHRDSCCAIFNSPQLARYFHSQGLKFSHSVVLTPSLNSVLRAILDGLGWTVQKPAAPLMLCIYGRPEQPRNCFAAIVDGLSRFMQAMSPEEREGVAVVSLGKPHADVPLAPGVLLRSLGRLPLEAYAAFLAGCHAGVAMMATPHPSYPPLEMAAFGLEVLTNRFPGKDLSASHPHITSVELPSGPAIAAALPGVLERARLRAGTTFPVQLPHCLSPETWSRNVRGAEIPHLTPPA
ncbi:rhamnosyltransferase WsaF family glycosyltransferase [Megalodesulfovibrio paquesii]